MPISLGFWEWGCPKRGDARITVTQGSKLVPRAFAVEIKALRARLVVQKSKRKKQQLFSQFHVEPLLGLKFPPYFLSDAKQAV